MIDIKVVDDPDLKSEVTEIILPTLPEWFGIEEAIQNYIKAVREQRFYAHGIKTESSALLPSPFTIHTPQKST